VKLHAAPAGTAFGALTVRCRCSWRAFEREKTEHSEQARGGDGRNASELQVPPARPSTGDCQMRSGGCVQLQSGLFWVHSFFEHLRL